VEQVGAEVRIVVARPERSAATDPIEFLKRLGPEARIEVVHSAADCRARCSDGTVDLVVADDALGKECTQLLELLRRDGPPVIVLNRDAGEAGALEAFRHGAADCVAARADFAEVLPIVALEQIERGRGVRDRNSSERRIRDLEQYNRNIIQNLNSALLVVDTTAKITFCNPLAERILGETAEALRGRPLWDWFAGIPRAEVHVARSLATGERFKGVESTITRSDGTTVPIGISCAPVSDVGGNKLGAVAVFSDLTEIQQLRRQVLQTEKMASIGQLAAGVAHEINNPMGFIHANLFQMAEYLTDLRRVWESVEALQKSLAHGERVDIQRTAEELTTVSNEVDVAFLLTDLAKAIRESQEGSERIRHIVQDLRDFSHRDTEQRVLTDINECLDSTVNIVWPMMKHLVVLEKDYRDLPEVCCYPMQLKQVFMNLLVNAYQAIEDRIGESGETGTVRLRTEPRGDRVAIAVTDTGVGIAAENLDRIFDPFFTTKKVGSGTGLGLSTCFNIVERHGGSLRVESEPGVKTTFTVLLPRAENKDSRVGS
jgi:two-component system NtrC family sensor kinase